MEILASCKWPSRSPGDGGQRSSLTRRAILTSAFVCALRAQNAEVSAFDFSLLDDSTVPNELFFVRNHFAAPVLSSSGWKLAIAGSVTEPFEISYDDLSTQAEKTLPVTIECAENPVGGGLASQADWTGASLGALLEKAKPRPEARFVRLTGADGYFRAIPIAKAMHPDTLLAVQMNGVRLPPAHGFPLRAIIPGWYGMDSVKWLRKIDVQDQEDSLPDGFSYRRRVRSLLAGARVTGPVTAMQVKSAFARPGDGAVLLKRRFMIRGVAWAGEQPVRSVEVSVDAGKTWRRAKFSQALPYAWMLWEYAWTIPGPGDYELVVRATDESGRVQPAERESDRIDGYELNAWQTVRVSVS